MDVYTSGAKGSSLGNPVALRAGKRYEAIVLDVAAQLGKGTGQSKRWQGTVVRDKNDLLILAISDFT
jgi:hypothetical protein